MSGIKFLNYPFGVNYFLNFRINFSFLFSTIAFYFFIPFNQSYGQFKLDGNATQTSDVCYLLTNDQTSQAGAAFNRNKVNLNEDFVVNVRLNFGNKNNGGDGIAFILQPDTTRLLGNLGGHGIGYNDLIPALIIEFDTYQNSVANDPAHDHIGMMYNGSPDHNASVVGPFPIISTSTNIEDGNWHNVVINWNADIEELTVYFDCTKIMGYVGPIKGPFLNGANTAFYGFTSSTGNAFNAHEFCLNTPQWQDRLSDLTFCDPTFVELDGNADGRAGIYYHWTPDASFDDPFAQDQEVLISDTTTFYLEKVTTCGQHYLDSFTVNIRPNTIDFDLGQDTVLCENDDLDLTVTQSGLTYLWSTGENSQSITVETPGIYTVTASDILCEKHDTIQITQSEAPFIFLPEDTVICNTATYIVTAQSNTNQIEWQDGSIGSTFLISNSGTYVATARNDCGEDSDQFSVEEENCDAYFIPNVFSPNNDGINDYFGPSSSEAIDIIERMAIFDRWGALIFEVNDIKDTDERKMWNGTFKDKVVNPGTYVYLIRLRMVNGEVIVAKGSVTVVR